MKYLVITLLAVFIGFKSYGQEDLKAKAILDKLSAKAKTYKTIKADFQLMINNKSEGIDESQPGKIEIKGDKYYLSIQGQEIISDGKHMYTILKESEEVHKNDLPDEREEEYINPNKIFTLYEKGFKYKFVKEENNVQIINLYPKAADEKSFHRVVLYVDKINAQIKKVKVYGKEGTNSIYKVKAFTPNVTISDTRFTFNKAKFPGFELIDLTDE